MGGHREGVGTTIDCTIMAYRPVGGGRRPRRGGGVIWLHSQGARIDFTAVGGH